MENLIPTLYKNYGVYVNTKKMIPSIVDGTIPVWRRILLGAHTVARSDFVKSATVFGYVIGHWHPHSEAIQGTAEILVKNGFLDGKGNWGTSIGIEPMECAAPRYTSLKINPLIEEMVFKYVKDVDWVEDELDPEPIILPAMIPICLFAKKEINMIGFGFKTEIPCYKCSDLINRLLYLLKKREEIIITPRIQGCTVLSTNDELKAILEEKGAHVLGVMGTYTEDRENFRVYIHGWNPRSTFSNIFNKIDTYDKLGLMSRGDVTYLDESDDSSGTKISFEVSKARNREKIYEQLISAIKDRLNASISFHMYAVDKTSKIVETNVDEMLISAYNFYVETLEKHFTRKVSELQNQINEMKHIEKIKIHLNTALKQTDVSDCINKLHELTKIPVEVITDIVDKYKIRKLMSVNTDLPALTKNLSDTKTILNSINDYAVGTYIDLLEKVKKIETEEEKNNKTKKPIEKKVTKVRKRNV